MRILLLLCTGLAVLAVSALSSTSGPASGADTHVVVQPLAPTTSEALQIDTLAVFGDSCVSLRDYSVQVNEKKRRVDVVMRYVTQKSGGCLTVVWQVEQPVSVAPLIAGDWTVRVRYTLDGKKFFAEKIPLTVTAP